MKHFAVNSQETRRMSIDMQVDERALREIYLPAFEYAVKKSEPTTIMAAYNKVNGSYCTENFHLLQEILRDEWCFSGAVVSDWGATNHVVECVKNGLNLEMPDSNGRHTSQIVEAVESGALSIEQLNSAVVKVLELIQNQSDKVEPNANCDYSSHHYVAKKVETDCAVLLKNEDNILPLQLDKKYLVVGAMAQKMRYQSTGSSHINTAQTPSILDVFQLNNISYEYAQGYDEDADNINVKLEAEAVSKAQNADYVLFFGGLTDAFEGEFADRKTMDMPTNQVQLLNRLRAVNENIVFVFFAGSPVAMPWISNVKALLNMYLGGQAVGE
ncbi:MAG: glycoside hydrolase family 3 C-terminal domain-containing protein, partial [Clostridia bacterium]